MKSSINLVNAWIFLNEDEPMVNGKRLGYNDPGSSYQRMIKENVYQSVDILYLCFATTTPTGKNTIPVGNGTSYTLRMGDGGHPGGLTNQDYMNFIIRDARKNNPNIKIAMTLVWGNQNVLLDIFSNPNKTDQQNADNFAANLITYLKAYDLDGFDIDWEYPICNSISQARFRMLFEAIGKQFRQQTTKHYYLTLSPASVGNLDAQTVNTYFDFVNVQLYSGFSPASEFTQAGINQGLLAYGAKFESNYQTGQNAFNEAVKGGYTVVTNWRLNSDNYVFEQDQQKALYKLAK
ncbi:glycoside hydrolase family 18 protein [Ascidiimonas sp. W6]|uniref:glycoside hydrolase family 18 protein n=1 Tax=Ascidiimonas meishanensis TaxID=3128903 RepID=UPI0030EDBEC4